MIEVDVCAYTHNYDTYSIAPNNAKHTSTMIISSVVVLLLVGLSRAVDVFLSPPSVLPSSLDTEQASFAISRHLGLEAFEPIDLQGESFTNVFNEQQFVGRGSSNAVLLTMDEVVAKGECQMPVFMLTLTLLETFYRQVWNRRFR